MAESPAQALLYPFIFVDWLYVPIRQEYETKNCAVYVILGYDLDGIKNVLGLCISDTEGKHNWMQIFDEIKVRGVEDVALSSAWTFFLAWKKGQRLFSLRLWYNVASYILSTIPLSTSRPRITKNIPPSLRKSMVQSTSRQLLPNLTDLKNLGNITLEPWVMYTTNAIESVNSSFRKVTRKGAFPHENAVRKILYLRILKLYKKWQGHPIMRWSMVRNQLVVDDKIQARIKIRAILRFLSYRKSGPFGPLFLWDGFTI